jgi:hypothetical protein
LDQQLGGVLNCVLSGIVMMLFAIGLFAHRRLGEAERRRSEGWARASTEAHGAKVETETW